MENKPVSETNHPFSKWLPWLVILGLIGIGAILWQPLAVLATAKDAAALQSEVARLGALAPLAYLALSVIQIVGAPIPGYPVQLLGGALFGTVLGGVYAVIGMLAGGLLAAWLARTLGRPFIENHVNPETLAKYENLAKLESLWLWVIILIIPLGDFPYYLAGLSRVKLRTLGLAILISRGPFTFLITWAGARSIEAPAWMLWSLVGLILLIVALSYLYRTQIEKLLDTYVLNKLE